LTQEFFARLLEKRYLDAADPEKGKFRSFLLTALKRFMANEWDRTQRLKRGGGRKVLSLDDFQFDEGANGACHPPEPADDETPERAFDRRWAITLLDRVLDRLEKDSAAKGKSELFAALKPFLTDEDERGAYLETATALKMTEGASRVAVHRLRQRYRELLRFEIAQTLSQPEMIDEEIRHLFAAVTR
jgi:RNA polymerase sigma-70 factor (ECF subfamily)